MTKTLFSALAITLAFTLTSGVVSAEPSPNTVAKPEPVVVRHGSLAGVPYLDVSVRRPRRIVLLIHGGPEIAALRWSNEFEGRLARRYHARIIKPVYYGSIERSASSGTPDIAVDATMSNAEIRRRLSNAVRAARRGMPQAVREVRRFLLRWDAPSTVLLGESFGASLAALAARTPHQSSLVMMSPELATLQEFGRAGMAGKYRLPAQIDPPQLMIEGRDRTEEILDTPARRLQMLEAVSLAYYEPWQDVALGSMLRRTPGRVTVIVGLRDRVGMVTGREWQRLRRQAPPSTRICVDPRLAHELPWNEAVARRCFAQAMRIP